MDSGEYSRVCSIDCALGDVAAIIRNPRPVFLDAPGTDVSYAVLLVGDGSIAFPQPVSVGSARNPPCLRLNVISTSSVLLDLVLKTAPSFV